MRIPIKLIPTCIMEQYQLAGLVHYGFVYLEISKGMYGLPQSSILANDCLQADLLEHGYKQATSVTTIMEMLCDLGTVVL